MSEKVKVTLTKSMIGRPEKHRRVVRPAKAGLFSRS